MDDAAPMRTDRRQPSRAGGGVFRAAWFWYLIAGAVVIAAAIPTYPVEAESLVGAASLGALIISIRRNRPSVRTAWLLMAAGQVLVAGALVAWTVVFVVTGHGAPYPSPIDPVYLASYPVFAAGLAMFVRPRPGHSPWEGVLDAGLITAGVASVMWIVVFRPYMREGGVSKWTLITAIAYPTMDLLLVGILAWLVFTIRVRTPAILLLVGSFVMLLCSDIAQSLLASHGVDSEGSVITLTGWCVSEVLFGAAALHPSMARTADPVEARAAVASSGRVTLYLVVAITGPAVALIESATTMHLADFLDVVVPLGLAVVVAALLVLRLTQLAHLANDRAMALDRQAIALEHSQHELRRAHQRMTAMFESAPTGMAQLDVDGAVLAVNPALAEFLGQSTQELESGHARRLVHPEDLPRLLCAINEVVHDIPARSEQLRSIDSHGEVRWADWVVSRMDTPDDEGSTAIAMIADRTDARRLEIELRHAQKLEAIGRLSAGVAHELNTPIQFIGDNVDFLGNTAVDLLTTLRRLSTATRCDGIVDRSELDYLATEITEAVRQTKDGVGRVATIVNAMKSFAHRDTPTHQPADINRALTDTLTVARGELRDVATVRTELAPLPEVTCAIGDLNQVFLNLLINAADAIVDRATHDTPGEIVVRSRADDDTVVIEVGDTGVGIPEHLLDRIFEPFFTTKAVGRGSGQGLALARTIVVDGHGGSIEVHSTPGHGSTFTLRIPVAGRRSTTPTTTADVATTGSLL